MGISYLRACLGLLLIYSGCAQHSAPPPGPPPVPAASFPVNVQGVVDFYGPVDLTDYAAWPGITRLLLNNFLGPAPAGKPAPQNAALASPVTHLDGKDLPMLLVHGERDIIVPVAQSRVLKARLDQANIPALYLELKGLGSNHAFPILSKVAKYERHSCTLLAFLQSVLKE